MELTVGELFEVVGGHLQWADMPPIDGTDTSVRDIKIDSRDVESGDVFWALDDRKVYAQDALLRGAVGVVTDQSITPLPGSFCLQVASVQLALWELATRQRQHFSGNLIAVTGGIGTSATREMLHQILGFQLRGTASGHDLNSDLGVPLSLLKSGPTDDYVVVEWDPSFADGMDALARLCEPEIGIVTGGADNEWPAGSDGEVSLDSQWMDTMPKGGCLVLNGDDRRLRASAAQLPGETLWFGRSAANDVIATHVGWRQGRLRFRVDKQPYEVGVWGRHQLPFALAAISVARLFGHAPAETAAALADFRPAAPRYEITQLGKVAVINDCYDASPITRKAALALLREFGNSGRRIIVSGDMLELSDATNRLHYQFGQRVVTFCGADRLVACGEYANEVARGATDAGMPPSHVVSVQQPLEVTACLRDLVSPGDVVLVQGCRNTNISQVMAALSEEKRMNAA